MVVGWTAASGFSLALRCCVASLRIYMADLQSRFAWSIGPMRRVHASAGASLVLLHSPVLTPLESTASVQTVMELALRTLFGAVMLTLTGSVTPALNAGT